LTNIKGRLAKNPDLTITVDRSDFNQVMMGALEVPDVLPTQAAGD
jgi:alkyl sulfatase BDS1-like metallo-beta-lactamase superfamily hydrolase